MQSYNLLTIEEVANKLLVSTYTVKRYIKNNYLVGVKLPNSHWRVLESSYIEFIEKCKYINDRS